MGTRMLKIGSLILLSIFCFTLSLTDDSLPSISAEIDAEPAEDEPVESVWNHEYDNDLTVDSLYDGDIVLTKEQQDAIGVEIPKRQKRATSGVPIAKWRGPIPYSVHPSLYYEDNFSLSNEGFDKEGYKLLAVEYLCQFYNEHGRGCYSYIGRVWYWKKQPVSLGPHCSYFHTIAHEIGHALGFFHEHNRADRDKYIAINFRNVKKDLRHNFKKLPTMTDIHYLPYDYASVMHYGRKAFSSNGQSTIISRDPLHRDTMGGATGPTFYDVFKMNYYYGCLNRCKYYRNKCQNGGYLHPRNCNLCVCPSGYGGSWCTLKTYSRGCGGSLVATYKWRKFTESVKNRLTVDRMTYCYWWIKSKPRQSIEIRIKSMKASCSEGCINGGVEIKASKDKRYPGYRFCCRNSVSRRISSWGPILPIIVYNKKYVTRVEIYFRLKKY